MDVEAYVNQMLKSFSGGRSIKTASINEGQHIFAPFSFRYYIPPSGKLDVHCGNLFIDYFSGFYQQLSQVVKVKNQLSFFFLVQAPEAGGELTLYDIDWDNAKEKIGENNKLKSTDGTKIYDFNQPDQLPRKAMPLESGDLIILPAVKFGIK